jgi:hypothetical protein
MKIYIDSDYRCHTSNTDNGYREFDVPFFDNKCSAFIEGYRYVPSGETWTRSDGEEFEGEMVAPAVDYTELDSAQIEHERLLFAEYETLINELYSEVTAE